MSVPFKPPALGAPYGQVEQATLPPYKCILNSGTGGPFLQLGEVGYISSTSLIGLILSAGWVHPEEGEQLREENVALNQRIHELEAALSNASVDAEKLAAADEILANARRNQELAAQFA